MSVLIKDMEKPKSCYAVIDGESEYCPFVNTDDDCVLLLKKGICEGTWTDQYSNCPLAEEPERKKGIWKIRSLNIMYPEWERYECSVCGGYSYTHDFCPNCGADMRGEESETE